MQRERKKIALSLLAVIAVAAVIFFFSSQEGDDSSEMSGAVTRFLLYLLVPGLKELSAEVQLSYLVSWSYFIRKCAHFSEYALLGMATVNYVRLVVRHRRAWLPLMLAWTAATVYACTDEVHQLFVSDRAGMVTDVFIDSAGALTGVLIGALILVLVHRHRDKKERLPA